MAVPEIEKYKIKTTETFKDIPSQYTSNIYYTQISSKQHNDVFTFPLPDGLDFDLSIDWEEKDITNLGGMIVNLRNTWNNTEGQDWKKKTEALGKTLLNGAGATAFGVLDDLVKNNRYDATSLMNAVKNKSRRSVLKNKILNFMGMEFQTFSLSFTLIPLSQKEFIDMKDDILRLQQLLLPINQGTSFEFPDSFDVQIIANINGGDVLYARKEVVITSSSLNFAGDGKLVFHEPYNFTSTPVNGNAPPVAMTLRLSFKDTELMAKDNYYDYVTIFNNSTYNNNTELSFNKYSSTLLGRLLGKE